jgi:hypothetical protein
MGVLVEVGVGVGEVGVGVGIVLGVDVGETTGVGVGVAACVDGELLLLLPPLHPTTRDIATSSNPKQYVLSVVDLRIFIYSLCHHLIVVV